MRNIVYNKRYLVYISGEKIYFIYEISEFEDGQRDIPEGKCSNSIEGAWNNFFEHSEDTNCAYDASWDFYDITGMELEDIKKKMLAEKLMK